MESGTAAQPQSQPTCLVSWVRGPFTILTDAAETKTAPSPTRRSAEVRASVASTCLGVTRPSPPRARSASFATRTPTPTPDPDAGWPTPRRPTRHGRSRSSRGGSRRCPQTSRTPTTSRLQATSKTRNTPLPPSIRLEKRRTAHRRPLDPPLATTTPPWQRSQPPRRQGLPLLKTQVSTTTSTSFHHVSIKVLNPALAPGVDTELDQNVPSFILVASLRSQITDLTSQVTSLNSKLVSSYTRIGDFEDDLHDRADEVTRLKARVAALEKSKGDWEREIEVGGWVEKVRTRLGQL